MTATSRATAKTKPAPGKKLNPNSAASKKYVGYLKTQHSAYATWLRKNAPGAKITSNLYSTLNAVGVKLNGTTLTKLRSNTSVSVVGFTTLYQQTMSESHKLINADPVWAKARRPGRRRCAASRSASSTPASTTRHPFFDPAGFSYPAGFPKCDARDATPNGTCKYVTPKVIVAKVFNNKLNQSGFDALPIADVGSHGTPRRGHRRRRDRQDRNRRGRRDRRHVGRRARRVAGQLQRVPRRRPGCPQRGHPQRGRGRRERRHGRPQPVARRRVPRQQRPARQGPRQRGRRGRHRREHSAGNEGPGGFTIGSPGRARNIITVGASTNNHFVGQPIAYDGPNGDGTAAGATGDFDPLDGGTFGIVDTGGTGCTAAAITQTLTGKIALINRGVCTFSEKVAAAKAKGAVARHRHQQRRRRPDGDGPDRRASTTTSRRS